MKIVQLTADNIKRLVAVQITPGPDSSMIVIGGDNEQGKTSLLDSIAMAIGGGDAIPQKPIRTGASKGSIVLETEEYVVTRLFNAKGTSLQVKNKEGVPISSPQALLDKLTSRISFDPLEFIELDAKEQKAALERLVGIDFTALDNEHAAKYAERTGVNRRVKEQQVIADRMNRHTDAPKEIALANPILERMEKAQTVNTENAAMRERVVTANDRIDTLETNLATSNERVAQAEQALKEAVRARDLAHDAVIQGKKSRDHIFTEIQALVDVDLEPISAEIRELEALNQKVRENEAWQRDQDKLVALTKESSALTDRLAAIEKEKADTLAKAKFPVEGLAFTSDGVEFKGEPFSQASGAQQLRVSVAMGFALAPELKVALIRNGSLLDDKSLALVAEVAQKNGGQVWIERVGKGEECTVILEAGQISEDRTQKPPPKKSGK